MDPGKPIEDQLEQAEKGQPSYEMDEVLNNIEPKMKAKVKRREEWGACEPTLKEPLETPVGKVVLSPTNTRACTTESECMERCREIQSDHMEQGEPDIKHNFLLGGDGSIYEGRGYTTAGPTYPDTDKKLYKISKNCLDIGVIGTMAGLDSKTMLRAAADCMIIGTVSKYLRKPFDLYWVENNEIQQVLPIAADELGAMQSS